MSMNEIEVKCRELRQLQNLVAEAEQEMEAIKDAIKAQLTAQGLDELFAGEYAVSWKPVKSSRVDTVALRKAMPDVAQAFTKTTTTRRFCVA
ncbi:MAG: hypothetical protein K2M15_08095 [Oscillospiraceae bacterium]|nr:hypothetical protein [Oscillospiraceae bacterium]MDE7170320.1 hypothetical protein [Oscillospiraceae bacterium]